jgi:hypothetical protein
LPTQRNRVPRSGSRAAFWTETIAAADADGKDALDDAIRWVRSGLARLEESRPKVAVAARWDLARSLCLFAARMPRVEIDSRAGLTDQEKRQLLNPWTEGGGR